MNNVSLLFENLIAFNESEKLKIKNESDSTVLNLSVEIPEDTTDITPEDVTVDVGVMSIDNSGVEDDKDEEVDEEKEDEVVVDEEDNTATDDKDEEADKEDKSAEESFKFTKESFYKKRLEKFKENKCKCTGKDDCECESCKSKNEGIFNFKNKKDDSSNVKESLMHLDTSSLNKLFTQFVKDNYKNIDKVVISKAVLENKALKLKGMIIDNNGACKAVNFKNIGFNPAKLENKRFIMDFSDAGNCFNIVKESVKRPFVFTATFSNNVLKFENLKYSFKTKINENTQAHVFGETKYISEDIL